MHVYNFPFLLSWPGKKKQMFYRTSKATRKFKETFNADCEAWTNVFVEDLRELPGQAPMTRSQFDNAYKNFVRNTSTIPKLPWKLKAMNKRESVDFLTDLILNSYWRNGGELDKISFTEKLLQEFKPVWWDESIWLFRFESCLRTTKMIPAGRKKESLCKEMIRLCLQFTCFSLIFKLSSSSSSATSSITNSGNLIWSCLRLSWVTLGLCLFCRMYWRYLITW